MIKFGAPQYLPLLVVPGVLLLLWLRQAWQRRGDVAALRRRRLMPVRERIPFLGELLFWLCLLLALGLTITAVARPQTTSSIIRTAGVDLIVLQDGSASMHVGDVGGRGSNRWRRSMAFLRMLGESLRWEDDRVALALFAHIATPQVRLTKDPNTYFFFLDHLDTGSPFRLEDDGSWDTNIERGLYWGLRLLDKDEEIKGKSANAKAFILVSDGQAWSGEVAKSLQLVQARGLPGARGRRGHDGGRHHPRSEARRLLRPLFARFSTGRRSRPSPRPAAGATSSWGANPIARSPATSSISPAGAPAARASRRRSTIVTANS